MAADREFTKKRGAERMRQSFARAYAAGLSQGDRDVLHAVHVETTGQTKITNRITHAQIAYHLNRLEPVESEDDLDQRERNRRERIKERIGQSLERLHAVGAIEYEPGRGGRLSRITLPAVDDADHLNPTRPRGVDEDSTPRGETLNPTPPRGSTPRGHVAQPHAATWGLPMETDRSPIGTDDSRSANGARPARSAQAPTPAELDEYYAGSEICHLIHNAVRRPDAVDPEEVLETAQHLAYPPNPDYWQWAADEVLDELRAGRTIRRPAQAWDMFRDRLAAVPGITPDQIPPRLDTEPANRRHTA